MKELQKRILTAIIGGSLLVTLIWLSYYGLIATVTLIALFSFYECLKLFDIQGVLLKISLFLMLGFFTSFFLFQDVSFTLFLSIFFWIQFFLYLFKREIRFEQVGVTLGFGLYLTLACYGFFSWSFIENIPYSPWRPLGLLFLIWTNDTAAYFIGRKWGKHPLLKQVSPKKSWEGFIGGFLCTLLLGYLFILQLETKVPWLILAIVVAIGGPIGDLVESRIKRERERKDSSSLLPGHGGFLDRFDAFFFVNLTWFLVRKWYCFLTPN